MSAHSTGVGTRRAGDTCGVWGCSTEWWFVAGDTPCRRYWVLPHQSGQWQLLVMLAGKLGWPCFEHYALCILVRTDRHHSAVETSLAPACKSVRALPAASTCRRPCLCCEMQLRLSAAGRHIMHMCARWSTGGAARRTWQWSRCCGVRPGVPVVPPGMWRLARVCFALLGCSQLLGTPACW
jgi:hypothetical protein